MRLLNALELEMNAAFLGGSNSWNAHTGDRHAPFVIRGVDADHKLQISGYRGNHIKLVDCNFGELAFTDSRIQTIEIERCTFTSLSFSSEGSFASVSIEESEADNISFRSSSIQELLLRNTRIGLASQDKKGDFLQIKGNLISVGHCKSLNIEKCVLNNQIHLTKMIDELVIESSTFLYGLIFENSETKTTHIINTKISFECDFRNLSCHHLLHIDKCEVTNLDFSCGLNANTPVNQFSLTNSSILKFANFNNRKFGSTCDFSWTRFFAAPKFHNCEIHQDTNFSKAEFLDVKGKWAENAYRTLKLAMNKHHAHSEEMRFFGYEMQARRHNEPWYTAWLYLLYEIMSFYGQSIARPIAGLAGLFTVFFVTYWLLYYSGAAFPDWNAASNLLAITFGRTIPLIIPAMPKTIASALPTVDPLAEALLIGLHSILAGALLFLLALGLRNKFRLKS